MKTCGKCGLEKNEADFSLRKDTGKLRADCKKCLTTRQKVLYKENKQAILAQKKIYRRENRETISAKQRAHREKNLEEFTARDKAYYKENQKKILAQKKIYTAENWKEKKVYNAGYYTENRENLLDMQKKFYLENRKEILASRRDLKYGFAPGDFERMLAVQGGVCAICSGPGGKKGLCIDHDHESGKIRALLCGKCNSAIGLLKDSSELVFAAAKYLKKHGK